MRSLLISLLLGSSLSAMAADGALPDVGKVYQTHCATCHGADRLGGVGPALLPENLGRLRKGEAEKVIADGRSATQMPAFKGLIDPALIAGLREFIYTPPAEMPTWDEVAILGSRIVHADERKLPAKPAFTADPMNLFIVVESGDHHASIIDGDRLAPIHRFQTRFALHGGPKFSPDGRFVYFASRDGWITKYDIWNLTPVAEVRAGINTRNAAVSSDGKFIAVANYLPHSLVILDSDLKPVRVLPVADVSGKQSSRVSAVYDAGPRKSFVAALKDVKEVWEISYDPTKPDIPNGMVHDFQYKEGAFMKAFLNPQRTQVEDYLDDFFFTQDYADLMGASRTAGRGQVINLDARRKVADLELPGMPHLGSGITWTWEGRTVMATPNLNQGVISIIDTVNWQTVRNIETLGPGFFMRSHENSPYAWTDSMMSRAHKDTLQVIDKQTLDVVARLRPEPGKTLAHVEFTRDGRYVLASLWERQANGGCLIVYDANTLQEIKRIPMDKPVGKYNLYNKINRSEGTSH